MSIPSILDRGILTADDRRKAGRALAAARWPDGLAGGRNLPAATTVVAALTNKSTPPAGQLDSDCHVLDNARLLLPLVDPNVSAWGRRLSLHDDIWLPRMVSDPDVPGGYRVTWASPSHLSAAFEAAYDYAMKTEAFAVDGFAERAEYVIDSWHSPLLVAAVRHCFEDGSPVQVRLTSLDGTRRIWGFRKMLSTKVAPWLVDHPYADVRADWNAEPMVAWRKYVAALRAQPDNSVQSHPSRYEDWAQVVMAGPTGWALEAAMMRAHRED